MVKKYVIGIVGCTGAVGKEIINVLFDLKFPLKQLLLYASEKSAGVEQDTKYGKIAIQEFSIEACKPCNLIFLAVSGEFALKNARELIKQGSIIIDNSSAFRYDNDVPLVIPQINGDSLKGSMLIANPNCTTAIAAMSLGPIDQKYTIKKIIISTYQASSGAGQGGIDELLEQVKDYSSNKDIKNNVFQHQLLFNVIPHIDKFMDNGYSKEEMKVNWELSKILQNKHMLISCTACRVPTLRAHAESIIVETEKLIPPNEIKELMKNSKGIELCDDLSNNVYPMPITATGKYNVQIGRIRRNLIFGDHGIEYFTVGDQLLRGAALNAVEIALLRLKKK